MKEFSTEPVVVRPAEACRLLQCKETKLYRLLRERELESCADGGARLITIESIERYLAKRFAADDKSAARSNAASVAARKARRAQAEA